ncbi:tRNA modification GTPase GTPBP3, mitochondrial isoform X2 [Ischnura elegans]|uniref:tRNA modification GTPase GTPBP3, mitochondrial isoform X2 n=1 Tax=Ischnura elegans TaxID=197161 RepID=UPI001ED8A5BF|nr:tRNA modification GTPase GTPBP3, mitochondrial isoform X2 [Ischnura elegans]
MSILFPGPRSFTGEDTCEFHVHGGTAVISSVLEALGKMEGYQPATAGEFTKRAFYSGKLDLLEVEGLGDLIEADTNEQRKQALFQMEGTLSKLYMDWRETLVKCTAHLEAFIDFSEEENLESGILEENVKAVKKLLRNIKSHLADGRRGERLRNGVRAVIIGEPNVGKSSLLNLLCQKQAAIVSPIPGTTRDIIERPLNILGFPVIVSDTAGLRVNTQDSIEQEGVKRARECIANADLYLLVDDAENFRRSILTENCTYNEYLRSYVERLLLSDILMEKSCDIQVNAESSQERGISCPWNSSDRMFLKENCVLILNKKDLVEDASHLERMIKEYTQACFLSCKTSDGVTEFLSRLQSQLSILCANPSRENPAITQSRHRHHLQNCVFSLESYIDLYEESSKYEDCDVVMMVEHLRKAMRSLGKITGHVSTDEVLDVIFSSFCIGK